MCALGLYFYVPTESVIKQFLPFCTPSVYRIDVDSITVVCASHPSSPEIFPIKIADLPQKWPFLPNFPFFSYVILYLKFKFGNRGGGVGWGEMFSKKLGKIKTIFKNLGSSFGGLHPPLLHPSVYRDDVDSITVVYTSHPSSPEIFPIKIADLPQKWPFLPNFPFFPYVILYLKFKFGNRGGRVRWGEMFSKKLGKNENGFQNSRVCFLGVPSLPSSTRVYAEQM